VSEYAEQCALFEWARLQEKIIPELALLNASANGCRVSIGSAVKMKCQGLKKGFPDISLPVARGEFHGLFIEMKFGKNKQSPEQKEWEAALTVQGYKYSLAYSGSSAVQIIKDYLNLKN